MRLRLAACNACSARSIRDTMRAVLLSGIVLAIDAGCSSWDSQKTGQDITIKNNGNDPSGTCAGLPQDLEADTEYKFSVTMAGPTDKICFDMDPCNMMADTSAPVAGCVHDCTQAKGVGSASFTAKCSAAGWVALQTIAFGCQNSYLGCECPATNPGFTLDYMKVLATTAAPGTIAAPPPAPSTNRWPAIGGAVGGVILVGGLGLVMWKKKQDKVAPQA